MIDREETKTNDELNDKTKPWDEEGHHLRLHDDNVKKSIDEIRGVGLLKVLMLVIGQALYNHQTKANEKPALKNLNRIGLDCLEYTTRAENEKKNKIPSLNQEPLKI